MRIMKRNINGYKKILKFMISITINTLALHFKKTSLIDIIVVSIFISECLDKYSNGKPLVDQLVIVVIDALRSDYFFNNDTPMSFIRSLVDSGNGLTFDAHVQSPTVTMPRIKVDFFLALLVKNKCDDIYYLNCNRNIR